MERQFMSFYNSQSNLKINWGEAANALRQAEANLGISRRTPHPRMFLSTEADISSQQMIFTEAVTIVAEMHQNAAAAERLRTLEAFDEAFDSTLSLFFSNKYELNIPRDYVPSTLANAGVLTEEWSKLHDLISENLVPAYREAKVAQDQLWEKMRDMGGEYYSKEIKSLALMSHASDGLNYIATNLLAEANFLLNRNGVSATLLLQKTEKTLGSFRSTRSIIYRPRGLRFLVHGDTYDYRGASCPTVEAVLVDPNF